MSEPTSEQPTADQPRLGWRPRKQAPAESYTSMRRFRAAARVATAPHQTGETPVVAPPSPGIPPPLFGRPGDSSGGRSFSPAAPDSGPLPRRGAPLFGPGGLLSGPLPRQEPDALAHPFTASPVTTRYRDTLDVLMPPELPVATAPLADVAVPLDLGPPTAARPAIAPRAPRPVATGAAPHIPKNTLVLLSSLVMIALMALIAAQPFGFARAEQLNLLGLPSFVGAHLAPTGTPPPSYAAMPLDTTHPPPTLFAQSAVVMDETTGAILYGKNPDQELPMASTTKLMTAVVALTRASPDTVITITPDAANTGGEMMVLHVGEKYTLRELLYGMLLPSANDAAEAVADGVAGNAQTFAAWMNDTAARLGLTHTHYVNPHGLPDAGHYSSARDLAVLGRYALTFPLIQQITTTRTFTITATAQHPRHDLLNMHQPQWWYPGADGGKPGWTSDAQFVDVLSAARDGHHLIAVLMHGQFDWVTDIRDLLNWGFNDFTWISPQDVLRQHAIPFAAAYYNFTWDVPSRTVSDATRTYFPYTGFDISGAFRTFFNTYGGLAVFGYPRSMPTPGAPGLATQHFDKAAITCVVATGMCRFGG